MEPLRRVRGGGLLHVPHLPAGRGAKDAVHAEHAEHGVASPGGVLATGCAGLFMLGVNTTAINAALPAIAADLNVGTGALSWAVGVYLLAVAALVVVGGRLGDLLGQRTVTVCGVLAFAAGAAIVAVADSGALLILGRLVQGVGGALVMPSTMAVLRLAYPPSRQGFALGVWGAVAGIAFAVGPLIGGVLTDELSWRWVWWGSAVWAVLVALAVPVTLRDLPGRSAWTGFDVPGTVLLAAPLFALVLAFQQIPVWGAAHPPTVAAFAAAVVGLVALVRVESRRAAPLLHLRLLKEPPLVAACVGTCVNTLFLIGLLYFFNLYAQSPVNLGYSAVVASLALLPYGTCVFAASLGSGWLCDRVGFRTPVAVALLCCGAGGLLLARVDQGSGYGGVWPGSVVLGLGVGITLSAPSAAGLRALPHQNAGEGAGIINVVRYVTAALVVSAGTLVFLAAGSQRLNDRLGAAGVPRQDDETVDHVLAGVSERLGPVEQGLGPAARRAVREGTAAGLAHGFATVMLCLGVLSLLSVPVWLALTRRSARNRGPRT